MYSFLPFVVSLLQTFFLSQFLCCRLFFGVHIIMQCAKKVKSVCECMLSSRAIFIFFECNCKIVHECVYCIGILECMSVHRHMHVICNSPFIFVSILATTRCPSLSLPPPTSMFFQVSIVKDPLCSLLYLYGLFHRYTCVVCFTVIPVWFASPLYLYGL